MIDDLRPIWTNRLDFWIDPDQQILLIQETTKDFPIVQTL